MFQNIKFGYTLIKRIKIFIKYKMPTHSLYLTTDIPTTTPAIPNISCVGADTSIEMTFSANSDGGTPITSYQYSIDRFIADINTIDINSSPYTIEDLTDGNTYNVELRAVNKNGFGEKTNSPDIIPGNIPSAPTINNISVGNASATISFSAPLDDGGSIIQYYIISFSNDDFVTSTTIENITTNPFTISSGLINGATYKFKLKAHNNFGDGEFSNIVSVLMRPSATGGTIIPNVGGYKYHIFTNTAAGSNTITFTQGGNIEYLIIAGGGAGGSSHGGGGGAGEVFQGSTTALIQSYTNISVGIGGTTGDTNGGDSSAFSITCKGGGRGGGATIGIARTGGSGGGGSGYNNPVSSATTDAGASTKTANLPTGGGLGNAGGAGNQASTAGGGGGGGGAGDVGEPGGANLGGTNTAVGGINGPGTNTYSVWILAIATTMNSIVTNWSSKTTGGFIASGGAGGSWGQPSVVTASVGGGGGGDGGTNNYLGVNNVNINKPTAGTPNTGGGGGGGGSGGQLGANGGSGLVVIRYLV